MQSKFFKYFRAQHKTVNFIENYFIFVFSSTKIFDPLIYHLKIQ